MFKVIQNYATYEIDGENIIILSKNYNGSPMFYHEYNLLLAPKETIERFKDELFPPHLLKKGWFPKVRYL